MASFEWLQEIQFVHSDDAGIARQRCGGAFVDAGLRRPNLDKKRMLALALRLLDSGMIRTGDDEYAKANGSRGSTTLRKKDVAIDGNS